MGAYPGYKFSICLYGSCNSDPLKFSTWVLTREWALARDTTVYTFKLKYNTSPLLTKLICYGWPGAQNYNIISIAAVFVNFLVSFILNVVIVLECIYYGKAVKQE